MPLSTTLACLCSGFSIAITALTSPASKKDLDTHRPQAKAMVAPHGTVRPTTVHVYVPSVFFDAFLQNQQAPPKEDPVAGKPQTNQLLIPWNPNTIVLLRYDMGGAPYVGASFGDGFFSLNIPIGQTRNHRFVPAVKNGIVLSEPYYTQEVGSEGGLPTMKQHTRFMCVIDVVNIDDVLKPKSGWREAHFTFRIPANEQDDFFSREVPVLVVQPLGYASSFRGDLFIPSEMEPNIHYTAVPGLVIDAEIIKARLLGLSLVDSLSGQVKHYQSVKQIRAVHSQNDINDEPFPGIGIIGH